MKINLLQICALGINGEPLFLSPLRRALKAQGVPAKTAYWLSKISTICEKEFETFNAVRSAKIQELGEAVPDAPGQFHLQPEKTAELLKELTSLDHEVDLGIPEGLKLKLPAACTPEDWQPLIALDLFEPPED